METITYIHALVLGILEGLTEFIPVSSTGHLILLGHALHLEGEKAETFEIFIQLGAILAVVVLYRSRFLRLFDLRDRSSFGGWNGVLRLGVACIPVFIVGALFGSKIKHLLFAPLPVATALIVGGLVMIWVERWGKREGELLTTLDRLSPKQALLIGMFQCFSLWPGVSRSASTIVGAMLVGCHRTVAAEFSFLVAVPVMAAAVSFDMLKSFRVLSVGDVPVFAFGFLISFVVALAAIRFFMAIIGRVSLEPFALYRIVLGAVVLWVL